MTGGQNVARPGCAGAESTGPGHVDPLLGVGRLTRDSVRQASTLWTERMVKTVSETGAFRCFDTKWETGLSE